MPNPTAAMLVIGDEILSGRTRDANTHYLAGELTRAGIDLREAAAPHAHEQVERHGERRGLVQDDLLELGELLHLVSVRVRVRV